MLDFSASKGVDLASKGGPGQQRWTWPAKVDLAAGSVPSRSISRSSSSSSRTSGISVTTVSTVSSSQRSIVVDLIAHAGFNETSTILDIGSDVGKPILQFSQCPAPKYAVGIEVAANRFATSLQNLEKAFKTLSVKWMWMKVKWMKVKWEWRDLGWIHSFHISLSSSPTNCTAARTPI